MQVKQSIVYAWVLIYSYGFYIAEATLKTYVVEDLCHGKTTSIIDLRNHPSGILMATPSHNDGKDFECQIELIPHMFLSVVLSFYRYDIANKDKLIIEDSDQFKVSILGFGLSVNEKKSMISNGKYKILYKRSNATSYLKPRAGFQLTFTEVGDFPCTENEFQCRNGKCISKDLVCDGHNHCGDNSNQLSDCKGKIPFKKPPAFKGRDVTHRPYMSKFYIIVIAIASAAVFVIILVFTIFWIRLKKQAKALSNPTTDSTSNENGNRMETENRGNVGPGQNPLSTQNAPSSRSGHMCCGGSSCSSQQPLPHASQPQHFTSGGSSTVYNKVCSSLCGSKASKVEEFTKQMQAPIYQVPSLYPNLNHHPTAPEIEGEENPAFVKQE